MWLLFVLSKWTNAAVEVKWNFVQTQLLFGYLSVWKEHWVYSDKKWDRKGTSKYFFVPFLINNWRSKPNAFDSCNVGNHHRQPNQCHHNQLTHCLEHFLIVVVVLVANVWITQFIARIWIHFKLQILCVVSSSNHKFILLSIVTRQSTETGVEEYMKIKLIFSLRTF